ncbi:swr complex subunit [Podospora fimiseda]|uniref:SWR1-complex protein 5 n=1 Tax=Podospora fimiseda TaxID=252190 RepID=A0AAN7H786_9PEZI|nr:swr complex subunit [Podospora fimiseda]
MPPELIPEEDYLSEEDSDFAPEDVPAEESSASGDEDEEAPASAKPAAGEERKRPASATKDEDTVAEDAGFENSGDEAIIVKGKKRRKKNKDEDDEGGEGGLVKTRSMRAVEKAEKRANTAIGPVTVDIDAIWAQMNSEPIIPSSSSQQQQQPQSAADPPPPPTETSTDPSSSSSNKPELIRIKRTYNFAGKVHTEEKLVARDSAEAKLYLAENPDAVVEIEGAESEQQQSKRILRKAFRSAFEPVTPGMDAQRRSDLNLGMAARLQAREELAAGVKKLNTVEKSRMDWAGFVDKEGIKDELELAGKSKHSFMGRQDFLARSEAVREDETRRARIAGKV